MGKDVVCAHLCDAEMDAGTAATARRLVQEGYVAEWIVDNLPGATKFVALDKKKTYYAAGFKLGYNEADVSVLPGLPEMKLIRDFRKRISTIMSLLS